MLFRKLAFLLGTLFLGTSAQTPAPHPYVVLISLDGFRSDYAQRYHAQNILDLARSGASAESLIPSFPSVTFPNHISIVTGKYPGHHGIVANNFHDPTGAPGHDDYSMSKTATDGTWYQAKPIWIAAEEQGIKTGTMFWPTSDAEIAGRRPSQWVLYDGKVSDEQRIAKVLDWLHLPLEQRPHLLTLYFSDADDAGHHYGPDSPEIEAAVRKLDQLIGQLRQDLQATGLPINLILVSDHGMQSVDSAIDLSQFADFSKVRVVNAGAFLLIYAPDTIAREKLYHALHNRDPRFQVYRTNHMPKRWHYENNPRIGDLFVLALKPVELHTTANPTSPEKGRHGYDPTTFQTMRAIFYAAGPNIVPGASVKPFTNVNIYAFIARILGMTLPNDLDGNGKMLEKIRR